jgi:invasion protein IalB
MPPSPSKRLVARLLNYVRATTAWVGAALIAGLVFAPNLAAHAMTRTEKTFGSWDVVCVQADGGANRCSMLQTRADAKTKRIVLVWSITSNDKKTIIQAVTVPAGVSIKEGVRVFVGDKDVITIGYDTCGPRLCIATVPLDPKLVVSIKSSQKASMSYVLADKQLVQVNVDLNGFAEAYDYFTSQTS